LQEKKFQILNPNTNINDAISFVDEDSHNNQKKKKKFHDSNENKIQLNEDDIEIQDHDNSL